MFCLDKLCRWNIFGIQGVFFSNFFELVYFQLVVFGSLYYYEYMLRVMYYRFGDLEGLFFFFKQNRFLMNGISIVELRVTIKLLNYSVNWSEGDEGFEIVNV